MSAAHSATEKGAARIRMSRVQRFRHAAHAYAGRREAGSGWELSGIEFRCKPPGRRLSKGSGQRITATSCSHTAVWPTEADHAAELLVAVVIASSKSNAAGSVARTAAGRGAGASQATSAHRSTAVHGESNAGAEGPRAASRLDCSRAEWPKLVARKEIHAEPLGMERRESTEIFVRARPNVLSSELVDRRGRARESLTTRQQQRDGAERRLPRQQ